MRQVDFPRPAREQEALDEIRATRVRPRAAILTILAMIVVLLSGAMMEGRAALRGRPNLLAGESRIAWPPIRRYLRIARERGALEAVELAKGVALHTQDRLARDSALSLALRPPIQEALLESLDYGNHQTLLGRDGWLFFLDDLQHVAGPGFGEAEVIARHERRLEFSPDGHSDPFTDILDLAHDLAARGVGFVFLPVPTKMSVCHGRFAAGSLPATEPLRNASTDGLLADLTSAGVDVFDPLPILLAIERDGEPAYLRLDSHWSPAAFDRVAEALAAHLRERFGVAAEGSFSRRLRVSEHRGDLGLLLGLENDQDPYVLETVRSLPVTGPDRRPFRTRRADGPVVLLGDSFSRLFLSRDEHLGDANFAAELTFHLQAPVALRAENDAGENFSRRIAWLRQPGFLRGKKVVVFEVAERALSAVDWPAARLGPPV